MLPISEYSVIFLLLTSWHNVLSALPTSEHNVLSVLVLPTSKHNVLSVLVLPTSEHNVLSVLVLPTSEHNELSVLLSCEQNVLSQPYSIKHNVLPMVHLNSEIHALCYLSTNYSVYPVDTSLSVDRNQPSSRQMIKHAL